MSSASPAGSSRFAWSVALAWGLIASAIFYYCWSDPDLDDFSGWIPIVVALQLPAAWALARRGDEEPLRGARMMTLAVLLWLFISLGAVLSLGQLGFWLWDPERRHLGVTLAAALCMLTTFSFVFMALPKVVHPMVAATPHPRGARQGLLAVLALGIAGVLVTAARLGQQATEASPALWLMVGLPLLWVAPLLLLLPRPLSTVPRAVARAAASTR